MRLHFPDSSRVKKAAKHLSADLGVPLASAQKAVASALGYRDWHELEGLVATGPPCTLDEDLPLSHFVERQTRLTLAVAGATGKPDGDVQAALSTARLTGNRLPKLDEQIAVRLACWRATSLPIVGPRRPGAIGALNVSGRRGETVILQSFGRPTMVVTHGSIGAVAGVEYVSPRVPRPLFLPMRLYMPYGYYTEADGARVIFSRDYHPLWRLRDGAAPERVEPWKWIKKRDQTHLWDDAQGPWDSPELCASLLAYLDKNGVHQLPILADALPLLVHDPALGNRRIGDGAALLSAKRLGKAAAPNGAFGPWTVEAARADSPNSGAG